MSFIVGVSIAMMVGGCIWPKCDFVREEWDQPAVFANFPPEGETERWDIYNVTENGSIKEARTHDHHFTVAAYQDGRVAWETTSEVSGGRQRSDQELRAEMERDFAELGLPAPTPPDWTFSWNACDV